MGIIDALACDFIFECIQKNEFLFKTSYAGAGGDAGDAAFSKVTQVTANLI
jgi:hypothetical protein